ACRRAVESHSSLQGVRVDVDAALSLAVLLLSESRARADQRLDGRDLPALGRGAWDFHSVPGALVSGACEPEAHDRSPCLSRWRQSRSNDDAFEGSGEGEGDRAER